MFNIMSPRDIVYWIRSARSDKYLSHLLSKHEACEAFDILYTQRPDPWGSILSFYQQQKYKTLLSFISSRRYSNAIDIGCGLGLFTRQLAGVADHVLGIDISETAIREACRLSNGASSIRFQCNNLYDLRADEPFDLVIISDVLYYLSPFSDERIKAARSVIERFLTPKGILLLADHYFFGFDKNSKVTRRIHDSFLGTESLRLVKEKISPFYLTSVFESQPSPL